MKYLVHYYDGNQNRTELVDGECPRDVVELVEGESDNTVALVVLLPQGPLYFHTYSSRKGQDIPVIGARPLTASSEVPDYVGA